jgi:hypothetical protein
MKLNMERMTAGERVRILATAVLLSTMALAGAYIYMHFWEILVDLLGIQLLIGL